MCLRGLFFVAALYFATGVMSLTVRVTPSQRARVDQRVVVSCITSPNEQHTVIWERHITGEAWVVLGIDGQLQPPFDNHRRYYMRVSGSGTGHRNHTFEILTARYEDTSMYRCSVRNLRVSKQFVIAVCDNPGSELCKCVEREGMYQPKCFVGAENADAVRNRYEGTITGLTVCLVIAILIAIGFALVASYDCFKRIQAKKKREERERQAARATSGRSPYEDSEQLTLDPNDASSTVAFNNEGFAPSYESVAGNTRNNGYGPRTPDRPLASPHSTAGTQPSRPVAAAAPNPSDALDPRNLGNFQFPNDKPARSPGTFTVGSGDLDLKTPYAQGAASPRQPYNDVAAALPPPSASARTGYTDPRRLEFTTGQYPAYESSSHPASLDHQAPRASTMI